MFFRLALLNLSLVSNIACSSEVTIPDSLRTCRVDADCVDVETLCSACCGLDSIAKKSREAFGKLYATTCENYRGGVCDCAPAPGKSKCVQQKCQRVPDPGKR